MRSRVALRAGGRGATWEPCIRGVDLVVHVFDRPRGVDEERFVTTLVDACMAIASGIREEED
jgi:hypothetical protein